MTDADRKLLLEHAETLSALGFEKESCHYAQMAMDLRDIVKRNPDIQAGPLASAA